MLGAERNPKAGSELQGLLETLVEATFVRGLGPGLAVLLLAAAPRRTGRVELKKVFVLNDAGEMTSEYSLDADCPIDYNDFLRVLPAEGIGDRESVFVGEYVFTAFQNQRTVFVLLSRGKLNSEDFDWIALLLKAANVDSASASKRPQADTAGVAAAERALAERDARLQSREADLAMLEVRVRADEANLRGRTEELDQQKAQIAATADRASQLERKAAEAEGAGHSASEALAKVREELAGERSALQAATAELETKLREAGAQADEAKRAREDAVKTLERERGEWTRRDAEAAKMRAEIESRVQELSQRFATMAKDRLLQSHKGSHEPSDAVKQAIDLEKAQLAKERKFLQSRAIEILERQDAVQARERGADDRETALTHREGILAEKEADLDKARAQLADAASKTPPAEGTDEARKDMERRVKLIQQKALELMDREERLRKRADELQALEDRLSGRIPAK